MEEQIKKQLLNKIKNANNSIDKLCGCNKKTTEYENLIYLINNF